MKPMMSRDGSAEVYAVGKDFIGISTCLMNALQKCKDFEWLFHYCCFDL